MFPQEKLNSLKKLLQPPPLIIGIGNELRGDDAAGILMVEQLRGRDYPSLLNVYSNPENYLHQISNLPGEQRLWIDVINWDSDPGDFRIFDASEIQHFAISTHNFSPAVLLEFLKTFRDIPDYFLGIQPKNMRLGEPVSPEVERTLEFLVNYISECVNK